jgi:alkylated DNA repair dioxygenase AlkB
LHNAGYALASPLARSGLPSAAHPNQSLPRDVTSAMQTQPDLFAPPTSSLPAGFKYQADLLSTAEEQDLVRQFADLPFKEFKFHGFFGKRRVVSFGWRYDFGGGGLSKTEDIPPFLLPVRAKAAAFAQISATELQHALLTEYPPGAAIGWHKDRGVFGISLLAACTFRFRRKAGAKWQRASFVAEPRSAYLLDGPARRMGAQHPGGRRLALLDHVPGAEVIGVPRCGANTCVTISNRGRKKRTFDIVKPGRVSA